MEYLPGGSLPVAWRVQYTNFFFKFFPISKHDCQCIFSWQFSLLILLYMMKLLSGIGAFQQFWVNIISTSYILRSSMFLNIFLYIILISYKSIYFRNVWNTLASFICMRLFYANSNILIKKNAYCNDQKNPDKTHGYG